MTELLMSPQAHMTNLQFFGVSVALASVMIGYTHLQKRDQRTSEEMNQTFVKRSEWEETKDKLLERFLSQEEKIRAMEEERKTLEVQMLKLGKRLDEVEVEEKKKGGRQRREGRNGQLRSPSDPSVVGGNLPPSSLFLSEDFSSPWTV